MAYELDPSYKQVPERIADLKAKYPDATLQPVDPARPFWFEAFEDRTFVCYAAACYRTPDDPRPGIGVAWEQFPGTSPYTKNSEVMNAETSAWGRAIIAALASESKAIASAEEVRNRKTEAGDYQQSKRKPGGGVICSLCGESLAGKPAEVIDGKPIHKGGCP